MLRDGRTDLTEIAQECGVSKNVIRKRFGEMKKAGVITGATIQMDYRCFGYNVVMNVFLSVESHQIEQILQLLREMPHIHVAYRINARYNIRVIAILKNLNELDYVKESIRKQNSVMDLKTYVWTDIKNIPENLSIDISHNILNKVSKSQQPANNISKRDSIKFDEIDMHLIEKLAKNGRAPFNKVAKEIGTSTDTAIKRYNRLRERGAIKAVIQIDPGKLGYQAFLYLSISLSQNNLFTTVEKLAKLPDVIHITKVSGDYDVYVEVLIKNIKQMLTIYDEIQKMPGIKRVETGIGEILSIWPTPRQYISTF